MLFKLINAPTTFYIVINIVINKYLRVFMLTYLNNVLVYTNSTLKEHKKHVKKSLLSYVNLSSK
jgi:hypothetical protein